MKAGTIFFAGTDLGLWGPVKFTLVKTPDPAPPARATHRRVEISVILSVDATMPATAWARARAVEALLSGRREGLLEIRDENGSKLAWNAVPGESSLPEAIARGRGRVEMKFSSLEAVAGEDFPLGATVDPLNGDAPLTLHRVTGWNFRVSPSRPDSRSGHRTEVTSAINFSARSCYADPLDSTAARADRLMAEQVRLETLAGKEALLTFGDFSRTVQFESVTAKPSEGWEYLEVEAQARRVMLPGDTEAEVQFTSDTTQDPATGETKTLVAGSIRAPDPLIAEAKVEAILTAWRSSTRRVVKIQKTDEWLDGEDADTPEWIGLKFQIELSEGSSEARYTLKIDTREDESGARTTYSGTVHADTLVTLLATVETAAGGKHPVEIRSELSVEYATDDLGVLMLSHGNFSREYATAAGKIRGTIQRSTTRGNFSEWTTSTTGTLTAATLAAAKGIARSLIPAGVILRGDDEREASATYGTSALDRVEQEASLEFTYSWGSAHTHTAISYKDSSVPDYIKMTEKRTIAGTCWAMDKLTAAAQVTLLLTELGMNNPTEVSLVHSHERQGNSGAVTARWLAFEFSYGKEGSVTGIVGHDIIEANWRIQRVGMVNYQPITEIPMSMPLKQSAFGYNVGRLTATGSIKARQQATARSWGQGKRAAVASHSGEAGAEDPPDETMAVTLVPFDGTTVATHEFSFSYSFRYAAGMTGVWPSSGLTL
jgi:hypothetical protein